MVSAYTELVARIYNRLPDVEADVYKALLDKVVLEAQLNGYSQARILASGSKDPDLPVAVRLRMAGYLVALHELHAARGADEL